MDDNSYGGASFGDGPTNNHLDRSSASSSYLMYTALGTYNAELRQTQLRILAEEDKVSHLRDVRQELQEEFEQLSQHYSDLIIMNDAKESEVQNIKLEKASTQKEIDENKDKIAEMKERLDKKRDLTEKLKTKQLEMREKFSLLMAKRREFYEQTPIGQQLREDKNNVARLEETLELKELEIEEMTSVFQSVRIEQEQNWMDFKTACIAFAESMIGKTRYNHGKNLTTKLANSFGYAKRSAPKTSLDWNDLYDSLVSNVPKKSKVSELYKPFKFSTPSFADDKHLSAITQHFQTGKTTNISEISYMNHQFHQSGINEPSISSFSTEAEPFAATSEQAESFSELHNSLPLGTNNEEHMTQRIGQNLVGGQETGRGDPDPIVVDISDDSSETKLAIQMREAKTLQPEYEVSTEPVAKFFTTHGNEETQGLAPITTLRQNLMSEGVSRTENQFTSIPSANWADNAATVTQQSSTTIAPNSFNFMQSSHLMATPQPSNGIFGGFFGDATPARNQNDDFMKFFGSNNNPWSPSGAGNGGGALF